MRFFQETHKIIPVPSYYYAESGMMTTIKVD